jgi:hypothetical protein
MEKIGLYTDEYRTELPPEANPVLSDFTREPVPMAIGDVTASSERPGFDAVNAVDDNAHTAWHPQHGGFPAWIQVDLRTVKPVKGCKVVFGLPERFTYSYRIEHSKDGTNWSTFSDHTEGDAWQGHTVFEDRNSVDARFLRLTLLSARARKGSRGKFWPMSGLRSFEIVH